VHPIAAVQTEYSLWTRNPEIAVLAACRELGTTFVSFSPVARGFLADGFDGPDALAKHDIRRSMPRFQPPHLDANLKLLAAFKGIAAELGITPGQLSLAWLLNVDDLNIPIPGTGSVAHMEENFAARDIVLPPEVMTRLDALINRDTVSGPRYAPAMQASIDTEEFAA
jgi:aryl-alcohol dehydrogenase-like predicted oxidoreductase